MRRAAWAGALGAALLALAGGGAGALELAQKGSLVLELFADDFDENKVPIYDGPGDFIAVAFYAPWCQQTHKFMPEYERMAEILQEEKDAKFILARVNAELPENQALSGHYKIRGYPYIFYFNKHETHAYAKTDYLEMEKLLQRGLAKARAMLDWIKTTTEDVFGKDASEL